MDLLFKISKLYTLLRPNRLALLSLQERPGVLLISLQFRTLVQEYLYIETGVLHSLWEDFNERNTNYRIEIKRFYKPCDFVVSTSGVLLEWPFRNKHRNINLSTQSKKELNSVFASNSNPKASRLEREEIGNLLRRLTQFWALIWEKAIGSQSSSEKASIPTMLTCSKRILIPLIQPSSAEARIMWPLRQYWNQWPLSSTSSKTENASSAPPPPQMEWCFHADMAEFVSNAALDWCFSEAPTNGSAFYARKSFKA